MADSSPDDTGTPRWVKVFGIIAAVLVLLFVVLQFVGEGGHGPGRHLPGERAPSTATGEGHVPPPGMDHGGQQP